ncbi:TonB-dependent receptor (plasmid) [Sphingobium sp. V4]|uniref:TonB-dependent receptor n=1 Tax=Sphingobium sp. V4 TaxID=3038927 RepID=UPI002557E05E|nr:TonB-dependent receptor [Sphingobium sp. V4]WIW90255.1 TonB-dependent receptor [Sphingobium sp. V4]
MVAESALRHMTRGLGVSIRRVGRSLFIVEPSVSRSAIAEVPGPGSDPDILVTARRRLEKGGDVPLMVAHDGPDMLSRQAVRTLADLARVTPGFVATGQTSSAMPLLVMRGQRRSINDENRLPLVVYQEEVPLPNQAALSPLYDMASIEILRGPQGTLFGRSTTSGAILLHSARPGDDMPSYVETDVGNYGMNRIEGAIELPARGPWSLRVAGQRTRRDGFIHMASGGRADDAHSDAARAVLRFAPEGRFRSLLTFDMLNADERGSAQILTGVYGGGTARTIENAPYFDCGQGACDVDALLERQRELGRRTSQSGLSPLFRRRFRAVTNISEYGDDDLLLRNIAGWRSTRIVNALDGDATPLAINDLSGRANLRQLTEEFQVQGKLGGTRYIAGVFFLQSVPVGTMLQRSAQFIRPGKPVNNIANYQTFRSAALFGQVTLPLAPTLTADLGLRYTVEKVRGCSLRSADAEPLSRTDCIDTGGSLSAFRSGRVTWTAALTRRRGESSLYLTSRRAFRSGGYNSPTLGGRLAPFQQFGPESFTDIEAGAKGRWAVGSVHGSYSAAIYAGVYRNIQRALFPDSDFDGDGDPGNDPISFYVNISRARVMGMDGELAASVGSHLRATVSFSYVDARYTKVDASALLAPLLGSDPINNRFSYTPRFSGVVDMVREFPLPDNLGRLELGIDYSHVSTIRFAERANDRAGVQPTYGLLGGAIGWKRIAGRPLDLEIWGRNLTNRYYVSAGGTLNPIFTAATIIPGAPRTLGVRMRYAFE